MKTEHSNIAIMVLLTILIAVVVFGALPKAERAVEVAERLENKVNEIYKDLKPIATSTATKAAETIKKVDGKRIADQLSDQADRSVKNVGDWVEGKLTDKAKENLKEKFKAFVEKKNQGD